MDCPECGAAMHIDSARTILVCPYCGNTEPLDEVTANRLNTQDEKEVELERIKLEEKEAELRSQERREQARRDDRTRRTDARIKGASSAAKKLVIGFIIFIVGITIISVIGTEIEDSSYKTERIQKLEATYDWPSSGLAQMLDKPDSSNGYISMNSVDTFEINVKCPENSDFVAYVKKCTDRGFTVDTSSSGIRYEAYDESGNHLEIYYYESYQELEITLKAAIQYTVISWPTSGVGALVPAPSSNMGKIVSESATSFHVYIANMDREAFAAYANECIDAGFNVDYSRSNDYFRANNADGVTLDISYEGYNTLSLFCYDRRDS